MALSKEWKSEAMKGALRGLVSELGAMNMDRAKKKKMKKGMPKGMPPKNMPPKGMGDMGGGGHSGH